MKRTSRRRTPAPVKGFAAGPARRVVRRAQADVAQGREDTDCRRPDRTSRKHCP